MSKILFEINYNVNPDKIDEYLECVNELKELINGVSGGKYFIFRNGNKNIKGNFSEIYLVDSDEELDKIEDNQDERTKELINLIANEFIIGKKINYSTKYEI